MPTLESSRSFADTRGQFHDPSITIIYNERAGLAKKNPLREMKFRHTVHSLKHLLSSPELYGFDVALRPTKSVAHAIDEVDRAIGEERGAIAVLGGDGTIAPIAYRLALENETELTPKPDLLLFGGGTQNIFQRQLSTRKDPFQSAIDLMQNGQKVKIDLGVIECATGSFPFAANSGFNADARILDLWQQSGKTHRGELFSIFMRERHNLPSYNLAITDPEEEIDRVYEDVLAMPIVNAGPYAGFFPVTDSNMTDGIMETVVLPASLKKTDRFVHLLSKAVRPGKTIEGAHYLAISNARIRETNGEEIVFQHDGDPQRAGASEVTVSTLSQAVTVWTSKDLNSYAFQA